MQILSTMEKQMGGILKTSYIHPIGLSTFFTFPKFSYTFPTNKLFISLVIFASISLRYAHVIIIFTWICTSFFLLFNFLRILKFTYYLKMDYTLIYWKRTQFKRPCLWVKFLIRCLYVSKVFNDHDIDTFHNLNHPS